MSPKWLHRLGHVVVFCRCRQRWHCGERLPGSSRRDFAAQMMTSNRNAVETSINFYVAVPKSIAFLDCRDNDGLEVVSNSQIHQYFCQMASIQFASCCFMACQYRNTVGQSDNQFISSNKNAKPSLKLAQTFCFGCFPLHCLLLSNGL